MQRWIGYCLGLWVGCLSSVFAAKHSTIDCHEVLYLKPYQPPSLRDEVWDSQCSREFLKQYAPHGFVTVFGIHQDPTPSNRVDYALIYDFAKQWSANPLYLRWPIATGGGGGIMQAATEGAKAGRKNAVVISLEANIPGFLEKNSPDIQRETFGYRNLAKREADMIDLAHAVVIGLGSIGTTWELAETLVKIQTQRIAPIPVILLINRHNTLYADFLQQLMSNGLLEKNFCQYIHVTDSASQAITLIDMPFDKRKKDSSNLCNKQVNVSNPSSLSTL